MFGAVIAKGLDYRETFQVFQPGFDLAKARQQRADAGISLGFGEGEPDSSDVRPVLAQLRTDGLWVGIGEIRRFGRAASCGTWTFQDMIATSDNWGVSKPDPGFFRQC